MNNPLTIFLVSAADNIAALAEVQGELLAYGHPVQGRARYTGAMQERRLSGSLLLGEEDQIFEQLALQVAMADLFVLVAPDDHDAACLTGMAHISGVPVAIISRLPNPACCFMVKGCVRFWVETVDALLEIIADWPDLNEGE